ncbi:helix-turn-helix domain-containing protein [Streptomyces coelicoflavus]|uniref:helix-turn-helix domain-containing protein n=1 Tax=Streptomyces coelicoflavus TaxID=285562 RepID=UPI0036ACB0E4
MRWQLRLRAAECGVFTAVEMRRLLAGAGLRVSAGKMSALWSVTVAPVSVRLDDLEVICRVLGCDAAGLLALEDPLPGPPAPPAPPGPADGNTAGGTGAVWAWNEGPAAGRPSSCPRPSLPPV